jgi:hypothetical protein
MLAEDACLLEIMPSPTYQNQLRFIHQVAPKGVLDAADGSPMVSVWRLVVSVLFNNFCGYQPPCRFPDHPSLNVFDPKNSKKIPRRTPELLKNRYRQSTLSGHNKPLEDELVNTLDLGDPLHQSVLYWWKVMDANGDATILQRQVKLVPDGVGINTSDPQSITRSLAAAHLPLHSQSNNISGGRGRKGGSSAGQLLQLLSNMGAEFKASEEKENVYWDNANTRVLMDSRDKVQEKLKRLGDEIRGLKQNTRKCKRLISQYKRSRKENALFEHQLSQSRMGIQRIDMDIENNNALVLEEDKIDTDIE